MFVCRRRLIIRSMVIMIKSNKAGEGHRQGVARVFVRGVRGILTDRMAERRAREWNA